VSWLRNHVRHFVVPTIKTLAKRNGLETHDHHVRAFVGKLRPSSKCKYYEAGLVYAAASSFLRKGDQTRDVALGLCRQLGGPNTAEFVYELDSQDRVRKLGRYYDDVDGADVLHSFLCNSMRALRRLLREPDARIIYPGRDVWAYEVMSQRASVPSIYDSRVSREIDSYTDVFKPVVESWDVPDWSKVIAFDSGWRGTVPRAIGRAAGQDQITILMMSATDEKLQLFGGHTGSRAKALALEYLAKYRQRCTVKNGEPHQPFADLHEFIKAALLTIWLWHHKSPRFLPSWREPPPPKPMLPAPMKRGTFGSSFNHSSPTFMLPSTTTGGLFVNSNMFQLTTSATTSTSNIIDINNTSTSTTGGPWWL
jgi:hypothetical protein